MSKILITGGSGFIGTNLVDFYDKRGHEVLNIDIAPPRNPMHTHRWKEVDILDKAQLENAVIAFDPDHVFHMAARTDLDGKALADYRANTEGVNNVIELALELRHLKRIMFASSMLVARLGYSPRNELDYHPSTLYGESKVIGETLVRERAGRHLSWLIVRPTSIWGPWFGVPYLTFFDAINKGIYFHPRGKTIVRSYGFVYNSVFQLDKLANCAIGPVECQTYYLADYEPTDLRSWAAMIREAMGAPMIREIPLGLLRIGAMAGDVLKLIGVRDPPLTTFRLNNLLTSATHDLETLKAICGDLPFSKEEGVRLTVEWMRRRGGP